MTEVVELLRDLLAASLTIEAELDNFFQVYKTWGRDDQCKKAQEFIDRFAEVRHIKGHMVGSLTGRPDS